MTNIAKVKSFSDLLKLESSCGLILHLSADSVSVLHKIKRTGKTNIKKGGMNR